MSVKDPTCFYSSTWSKIFVFDDLVSVISVYPDGLHLSPLKFYHDAFGQYVAVMAWDT